MVTGDASGRSLSGVRNNSSSLRKGLGDVAVSGGQQDRLMLPLHRAQPSLCLGADFGGAWGRDGSTSLQYSAAILRPPAPAHTSSSDAQHQARATSVLPLFPKLFAGLRRGELGAERCIADSTDQAKE